MNKITVVMVGLDGWDTYTKPAIDSIFKYEPDIEIVVIDCGKEQYPYCPEVTKIRIENSLSYAHAMNIGAMQCPQGDWFLFINNDVLCTGKFSELISEANKNILYGRQIIKENDMIWFGLWIALVSKDIYSDVGMWDEKFLVCGFEDADYCVRAKEKGYQTEFMNLPFYHYWGRTRWGVKGYSQTREDNIKYFTEKHGVPIAEDLRVVND